jgi:SAM-dependent methyltransferase
MHLTHPDAPRPASLTGITSLREHVERSQERVEQLLEDTPGPHPLVDLHHADAVFRSSAPPDHPLDPKAKTPAFSAILALDCAYHFRTRKEFLQQSLHRLAPGGRIGLADLSFDFPSSKDGWRTRLVSLLGVIPHENIVRPDEYVQMMEDIGFENVKLEDISSDVFPGFFNFLKSRGSLWPVFVVGMQGLVGLGMKFVIVTAEAPMQKHLS